MGSVLLVVILILVGLTSCANTDRPTTGGDSVNTNVNLWHVPSNTVEQRPTDRIERTGKGKAPRAFRRIDFKNLSYPISWRREIVKLKDGGREYYGHKNLGNGWFRLRNVSYVDATGDGRKEAVVEIHAVLCGVSCDGGSHLFYFYTVRKNRLRLLWRFETGSLGYGCGLKSFELSGRKLTLEVFNGCIFKGSVLEPRFEGETREGKFVAQIFTRYVLELKAGYPIVKKREVFPYPQEDVKNCSPTVRISHDQ